MIVGPTTAVPTCPPFSMLAERSVPTTPRTPRLAWLLLALGTAGSAAAWILIALALDRQCSWMAVVAALDAAVLLRLGGHRPGWLRALLAVIATMATILIANWGIAAGQLGTFMGMLPWESALKLGGAHALTLTQLANQASDVAWLWVSLVVAAIAAR
ncbi:MAG: hypothetical protein M3Q13_00545 [Pseudomonadota bacterium]|nr:hypothetical protein [Pseudomonadota bacterium]